MNFLSEQSKDIAKNNRMKKTRDLFKKMRDTKGIFHAKMDSMGEISITSDMQMTPPLWQKVKKTKESLDESERGE